MVLTPGHASLFADQGYTKQSVKDWLFEHCKVPLERFPQETSVTSYEEGFVRDGDRVCACQRAEDIMVVVAGGPEPYQALYCGSLGDTLAVTGPVEMPAG